MPYYDLTTSKQIQKVLTVSDEDLSPEDIDDIGLDDDLLVAMSRILPTWEAVRDDDSKPDNQARLRMFAKYFCAGSIADRAQIFILKKTTDGSNEGQRSDKDGWAAIAASLLAKASAAIVGITDDLGLTPETAVFSVISRVIPDRDVITQPRSTT